MFAFLCNIVISNILIFTFYEVSRKVGSHDKKAKKVGSPNKMAREAIGHDEGEPKVLDDNYSMTKKSNSRVVGVARLY